MVDISEKKGNFAAMFIAIITYLKPAEEVDRFLSAHCDFLAAYLSIGNFIAAGPQSSRTGGVILIKAENREEVDDIVKRDPWMVNELVEYRIIEFLPTMCADESVSELLNSPLS